MCKIANETLYILYCKIKTAGNTKLCLSKDKIFERNH